MGRPATDTRPLSITFVAPFGLEPKGTVSARAVPLARALADRGHNVTLLIPPWNDRARSGQTWTDAGVQVTNVEVAPMSVLDPPILTGRLARAIWRDPPDILHAFKPKAYSGLVAALWWTTRRLWPGSTRLVMDTDDWEGPGGWNDLEPYPRLLQAIFTWQERYGLTHAHAVTVASRALESIVWSHGVALEYTRYIPNGAGLAWKQPSPGAVMNLHERYTLGDAPIVLLYTRFFEFDLARLLAIWRHVVEMRPEAHLLVVGTGLFSEEKRFAQMLAGVSLDENVVQAGWVAPEELPAYLALADVAIYPMDDTLVNRTKCPAKLADLLAAGVPVVGEAVGQVNEYLGDDAGILVPWGNAERLAGQVCRLLNEPTLRRRIGQNAQRRLHDQFDWSIQAARLEQLYRELLD